MAKKSDSVLRIKRIFEIHKILRNKDGVSAAEIAEYLENKGYDTNERMVASDIADLRLLGAAISANKHKGYWYSKSFSMLEALEGVDSGNMNEILAFVRQKANDELFKGSLAKLLINLEQEVRNPNLEENPYIQFEKVELKNIEKLDAFYKYITEKRVLDIEYQYFGSEVPTAITILPVLLREYNNRWMLIAFSKEKNDYQNYPLDRIIDERFSSLSLTGESTFNAKDFYKNVIGSSVDPKMKIENVRLRVQKNRAFYVETKKWHHSQERISEDPSTMTFALTLKPNNEFWAKVMEHIEDIEILEPEWMVKEFRGKVEKVMSRLNFGI